MFKLHMTRTFVGYCHLSSLSFTFLFSDANAMPPYEYLFVWPLIFLMIQSCSIMSVIGVKTVSSTWPFPHHLIFSVTYCLVYFLQNLLNQYQSSMWQGKLFSRVTFVDTRNLSLLFYWWPLAIILFGLSVNLP